MLKKYATEFLDYCKVAGFSPRSRQSLEISLRELATYIDGRSVDSPEEITYGLLADFVADFRGPSVHKKKARDPWGQVLQNHFFLPAPTPLLTVV